MTGLPKTQTEVCKACGIVHNRRHWAEEATHHHTPATSPTTEKLQTKPIPKKHALWEDKAGQFIAQFSRSKTEPVFTENHAEEASRHHHRRTSSGLSRRDSGLAALDMRDSVIDFRDEDGHYDREWDHVTTKKA